jgi:hypothetical protein
MSKSINSIFIANIGNDVSPNSLVNLFDELDIAVVKQITIFPEFNQKQGVQTYGAYIAVDWHDTEVAYRFIKCVQDPKKEARLFYTNDDYWVVEKNPMSLFTDESFSSKWTFKFESPVAKAFRQMEQEQRLLEDGQVLEEKSKPVNMLLVVAY